MDDGDDADGVGGTLDEEHQIGIWDATRTLLVSDTLEIATASLRTGSWFDAVAPVLLGPGTYTIGATYSSGGDLYVSNPTSVSTAPGVSVIQARFPETSGLVFPTGTSTGNLGRFGPNFEFAAASVPLPGGAVLLLTGLAAGAALRRRRRG